MDVPGGLNFHPLGSKTPLEPDICPGVVWAGKGKVARSAIPRIKENLQ